MDKKNKIWIIIITLVFIVLYYFIDKRIKKIRSYSSAYSPVEYANYPNLTGNPVADIAILNQAGFRYDH